MTSNLSDYDPTTVPDAKGMRIGIVVSEWNDQITQPLLKGALDTLKRHGVVDDDIQVQYVPGSFELIAGSQLLLRHTDAEAIIAIGCVVRGETPHFDYICQGTTNGIAYLNATKPVPIIYGLITVNTMQQALDRCGGRLGNKGDECAITAIKMIALSRKLSK